MSEKHELQKAYHSQNISMRKNIRQIDLNIHKYQPEVKNQKIQKKPDINMLVVGPRESGKTSLLKTLAYAYNGYLNSTVENKQIGNSICSQFEIKKGKKVIVEGLSKVKELDQKVGIYGFQCISKIEGKNSLEKYSKAMQLLGSRVFGCIRQTVSQTSSITVCLVCISMIEKISSQQLSSLKFFITNLEQNKVKYMIIGTKVDQVLSMEEESLEKEKIFYVDEWCNFIVKELGLKNRNEILCLQNYTCFQKQKMVNSQTVNFYALSLLQRCIKKSQEFEAEKKKVKKSFWLCSC